MRPPFRWFGSKVRMAPALVALLPPHMHYVEPFAGSAAVLFAKPRSRLETLNDLDGEVVNVYRTLRTPELGRRLAELVELTPYCREEYEAAADALADGPVDDPLERARRFLVLAGMSIGRTTQGKTGWSYNIVHPRSAKSKRWAGLPDRLRACAERLEHVQVDALDWREVLARYDAPGTVFLLDPPYHPDVRPRSLGNYAHEMTAADHLELLEAVQQLKGAAVVTHYPHPAYDQALAGWHVVDVDSYADSANTGGPSARVERVWCSAPAAARLFA